VLHNQELNKGLNTYNIYVICNI